MCVTMTVHGCACSCLRVHVYVLFCKLYSYAEYYVYCALLAFDPAAQLLRTGLHNCSAIRQQTMNGEDGGRGYALKETLQDTKVSL